MKTTIVKLFAAVAAVVMCATSLLGAVADGGLEYSTSIDFKPGEWNSNYLAMKARADAENIPLVVFWANPGCAVCKKLEAAMTQSRAKAWMNERKYLFVFAYGTGTEDGKKAIAIP